jgi:hypothetical protein
MTRDFESSTFVIGSLKTIIHIHWPLPAEVLSRAPIAKPPGNIQRRCADQTALGAGRVVSGTSKPGADGLRGGKPGHSAPTGSESIEKRANEKAGYQRQTTQRGLWIVGSLLWLLFFRGNDSTTVKANEKKRRIGLHRGLSSRLRKKNSRRSEARRCKNGGCV